MKAARAVEKSFADTKKALPSMWMARRAIADWDESGGVQRYFMIARTPGSWRMSSKSKPARNRCVELIRSITATTDPHREAFSIRLQIPKSKFQGSFNEPSSKH
jgi:hypothetical protein